MAGTIYIDGELYTLGESADRMAPPPIADARHTDWAAYEARYGDGDVSDGEAYDFTDEPDPLGPEMAHFDGPAEGSAEFEDALEEWEHRRRARRAEAAEY